MILNDTYDEYGVVTNVAPQGFMNKPLHPIDNDSNCIQDQIWNKKGPQLLVKVPKLTYQMSIQFHLRQIIPADVSSWTLKQGHTGRNISYNAKGW